MVESEADCLSEEVMLGAVVFGHEQMQIAIKAINELKAEAGKPAWDWQAPRCQRRTGTGRCRHRRRLISPRLIRSPKSRRVIPASAKSRRPRLQRWQRRRRRSSLLTRSSKELGNLEYHIVRHRVTAGRAAHRRSRQEDGSSDHDSYRRVAAYPRLGTVHPRRNPGAGRYDARHRPRCADHRCTGGERKEPFMLHYNFPPFSVGETGMMGSPKRREIGHGNLARRGIAAVMPDMTHVSVRDARRLGNSRVERFELDGQRVRHQPRADGCRCADQGRRCRRRDGSR